MPFEHILYDVWAIDRPVLCDDTFLMAEIIWGHFIHSLSTPAVHLTWDESSPRRIQNLLLRVGQNYPRVRPSCAFRAMLVVLSIKETYKGAIAYGLDAELLWHMAFKSLAARHDRTFTDEAFNALTNSFFATTKMNESPKYIEGYVLRSLTDAQKPLFDAKIADLQRYWMAPWFPGADEELLALFAANAVNPAMSSYTLLKPQVPTRAEQTLVFPSPRRKQRLSSIVEELEPATPALRADEHEFGAQSPCHGQEKLVQSKLLEIELSSSDSTDGSFVTAPSTLALSSRSSTSSVTIAVSDVDIEPPKTVEEYLARGLGPIVIDIPERTRSERIKDIAHRLFRPSTWTLTEKSQRAKRFELYAKAIGL